MTVRVGAAMLLLASVSCAAARRTPSPGAAVFPFKFAYCDQGLQVLTVDRDRVLAFEPTLGAEKRYAEATGREFDELETLLQAPEFGVAIREFRVKSRNIICADNPFARLHTSGSMFQVPVARDVPPPAPVAAVIQLAQKVRDSHFAAPPAAPPER
jgi:hypothetical protein